MSKTVDLGPVSAYALAVKYGYTGTEEEWVAEMEAKRKEAVEAAAAAADSEIASANSASASASIASTASSKADAAANSATHAESYAVGGTGIRQNEDVDNAKYYYQQIKQISGGLSGALIPLGTVAFADLQGQTKQVGYMYNISDDFTTDDTFKDGSGYKYPAGTNVYYTADGYWDCLAGTITPEGIGALAVDGDSADNTVTFTSYDTEEPNAWVDVAKMQSGEKHISLFGKITAMFKNIRWLYKMLGTTDISAIGDGTATGAISTLNTNLNGIPCDAVTSDSAYFTVNIICVKCGNMIFINGTIDVLSDIYAEAVPIILPYGFSDQSGKWHNIQMVNIETWIRYDTAYIADRHIVVKGNVTTLKSGRYLIDQVLCNYKGVVSSN